MTAQRTTTMPSEQVAADLVEIGKLYDDYLAVTQPSLIRPFGEAPGYVTYRASMRAPLGFSISTKTNADNH